MKTQRGPDVREGPVPIEAVHGLLGLLHSQGVSWFDDEWLGTFIDPLRCAQHARAFKLDVSVGLQPGAVPRFSVNDTGEPADFRRRLLNAGPHLGLESDWLNGFLALSSPGDGQTTASVKWERDGLRVGLYFEELHTHSDPSGCREKVCQYLGIECPPVGVGLLGAVCVDFMAGRPIGFKEYRMVDLNDDLSLPVGLAAFARKIPRHPGNGQRRALLASRWDAVGQRTGHKLLWMTEATRPAFAARAWEEAFNLFRETGLPAGDNLEVVRRLVHLWPSGERCFVYPDLVSLNVDEAGRPEKVLLYVSLK